jgi:hypothetical protein
MSTLRVNQRRTTSIRHFLQSDTGGTLASQWRDDKIQELSVVNVTVSKDIMLIEYRTDRHQAALIAGVVSSAFSWPTIEPAPWTAKAVIYCTLFLSLSALTTGSQQSIVLTRYGRHQEGLEDLKRLLGGKTDGEAKRAQEYVWQLPVLLLNVSIGLFVIGLMILIWARAASSPDWDDDMKVCSVTR